MGLSKAERKAARAAFFAKPQACLRSSPLVKIYGWGLHHDEKGRVALVGAGTEPYKALLADPQLETVNGMRRKRA